MLSDLTKLQTPGNPAVDAKLEQLAGHARNTVRRLEEIVWAVTPANDSIEHFAQYLCQSAQTYLELAGVGSRFEVPDQLPVRPLTSARRHNLFLAAKEALHNAVRHGRATEVTLGIALEDQRLRVTVQDNGCGFIDTSALSEHRGSRNMRVRMQHIGGTFERRSTPGQGTLVVLTLPLTTKGAS